MEWKEHGRRLTGMGLARIFCAIFLVVMAARADAWEFSGQFALESRIFFEPPRKPEQGRSDFSSAINGEFFHDWGNGVTFTVKPFLRLDTRDDSRTHVDLRELKLLYAADTWEVTIGMDKLFWGVTESGHLVDIINQTDGVESVDLEEKLGQPMVHFSHPADWGVLDLFILPFFRERTYPGVKGRPRIHPIVDTDHPGYESSAMDHHLDLAMRLSHTFGSVDIGLTHFYGTCREPTLIQGEDAAGGTVLTPYYEIINQTGLDFQAAEGRWLWKLEAIHRTGQAPMDYFAWAAGFEYTFSALFGSSSDLGLIMEWLYDDRGDAATTPFENDIMAGIRFALNDMADTEILLGLIRDVDGNGNLLTLESGRRISDGWKVSLEAFFVMDSGPRDPIHTFAKDDYLTLEIIYYF